MLAPGTVCWLRSSGRYTGCKTRGRRHGTQSERETEKPNRILSASRLRLYPSYRTEVKAGIKSKKKRRGKEKTPYKLPTRCRPDFSRPNCPELRNTPFLFASRYPDLQPSPTSYPPSVISKPHPTSYNFNLGPRRRKTSHPRLQLKPPKQQPPTQQQPHTHPPPRYP